MQPRAGYRRSGLPSQRLPLQKHDPIRAGILPGAQDSHHRSTSQRERRLKCGTGLPHGPAVGMGVLEHQNQPINAGVSLLLHHRSNLGLDVTQPCEELDAYPHLALQMHVEGAKVILDLCVTLQHHLPITWPNLLQEFGLQRELWSIAQGSLRRVESHPHLPPNDGGKTGEINGTGLHVLSALDASNL